MADAAVSVLCLHSNAQYIYTNDNKVHSLRATATPLSHRTPNSKDNHPTGNNIYDIGLLYDIASLVGSEGQ